MMQRRSLSASALALAAATGASAAFTGGTVELLGELVPGHTTYRLYLTFDNPADAVLAVSGNAAVSALRFTSDQPLYNDSILPGSQLEDVLGPLNGLGDSWVTVGGTPNPEGVPGGVSDTQFSPDFLGGDGVNSVINGTFWEQADNGGYFDSNPGTPENGGSVLIAQFTVPNDTVLLTYEGTVDYAAAGAGATSEAFAFIPGPGAFGALAVAGLAGAGRRRRV